MKTLITAPLNRMFCAQAPKWVPATYSSKFVDWGWPHLYVCACEGLGSQCLICGCVISRYFKVRQSDQLSLNMSTINSCAIQFSDHRTANAVPGHGFLLSDTEKTWKNTHSHNFWQTCSAATVWPVWPVWPPWPPWRRCRRRCRPSRHRCFVRSHGLMGWEPHWMGINTITVGAHENHLTLGMKEVSLGTRGCVCVLYYDIIILL